VELALDTIGLSGSAEDLPMLEQRFQSRNFWSLRIQDASEAAMARLGSPTHLENIRGELAKTVPAQLKPEQAVRLGYRLATTDPSGIPDEIIRMNVDLVRARQGDPDAPDAFLDAARSLLRLGKNPEVIARALGGIRCPVLVMHGRRDRFVPAAFAGCFCIRCIQRRPRSISYRRLGFRGPYGGFGFYRSLGRDLARPRVVRILRACSHFGDGGRDSNSLAEKEAGLPQ
jgi:pimeloyl-ACP methyl ester carboxylesterase